MSRTRTSAPASYRARRPQKLSASPPRPRGTSWRVRWRVDGQQFERNFSTERVADRFRRELLNAHDDGARFDLQTGEPSSWGPTDAPTVLQWLDEWLAKCAEKTEPANTLKGFLEIAIDMVHLTLLREPEPGADVRIWARNYFTRDRTKPTPEFAGALLLGAVHVERWSPRLDEVEAQDLWDRLGRKLGGGKARPTYATRRRNLAGRVLKDAVKAGHLAANPFDAIEKDTRMPSMEVDPRTLLSPEESRAHIARVTGRRGETSARGEAYLHTILESGCRPAEALGLTPGDIIRPNGEGRERHYLMFSRGLTLTSSALSKDGVGWESRDVLKWRRQGQFRIVEVRKELIDLIDAHIERFGTAEDGRIFVTKKGAPIATSLAGVWRDVVREQYPTGPHRGLRPYDLRHTHATACLRSGVDEATVAKRLGNSIDVLRKTYRGCFSDEDADAAKILKALA